MVLLKRRDFSVLLLIGDTAASTSDPDGPYAIEIGVPEVFSTYMLLQFAPKLEMTA